MIEYEEEVLKVASNPAPDKSKAEKDTSIHQKTTEIENHSKETKEASYDSEVDDDASSDINALSPDWKIALEASDCGNLSNSPWDVSVNRGILSQEIVKIKNQDLQTSTSLILHYQPNQQVKFFRHH